MSHVLIWKNIAPGSEYDIFRAMDCDLQYTQCTPFNVGNRLWFQGIMSAIDTGENQYAFLSDCMTTEKINAEYDFIILPMANIFNIKFHGYLELLAQTFSRIKIPVYVIACGAQAENYDALDLLINKIGELSKQFIGAVYNTGGEFALRGAFTKEFFDRLGFPSAIVTGCPSMYQLGKDFVAANPLGSKDPIVPVFNGEIPPLKELMEYYPDSLFTDQGVLWKELYFTQNDSPSFRDMIAFYCNYSIFHAELLSKDRICLIPDMNNWWNFLKRSGFNYSFGSRIHGNIMAILSGIPATVAVIDSRTQEMADFFNIPYVNHISGHVYTPEELTTLYAQADYTKFNRTYQEKYTVFADFLTEHGIVTHVNQCNPFFSEENAYSMPPNTVNVQYYKEMLRRLEKDKFLFRCAHTVVNIKNKLAK